jgi:transcriptional regulator with XRE-family HTH domain
VHVDRTAVPSGRPGNALGAFLKARRALVSPEAAGIATSGRRGVRGLRREEVATLAGISGDYYLRLERGRDRNPSAQVLGALGRVLRLDDDLLDHLHALVREHPRRGSDVRGDDGTGHADAGRDPVVPVGTLRFLEALTQPAVVETPWFDVVASNAAARRLSPRLVPGRNQLRDLVTSPDDRALYPDRDALAVCLVGNLRQVAGTTGSRRPSGLAAELSLVSDRFRELWDRHDVQGQRSGPVRLHHPVVGPLTLDRERLAIEGTSGLSLVVFHAGADSTDATKLAELLR